MYDLLMAKAPESWRGSFDLALEREIKGQVIPGGTSPSGGSDLDS